MRKLIGILYLLYASLIFFMLMVFVLPFIILATTIFKAKAGRKISFLFLKIWAWGFSVLTFLWFANRAAKQIDTSKPYIYVGNHGSFLDAVAVVIGVPQAFSPLGKIEIVKTPIFGWIYKRLVVLIDRSSKLSREQSVTELKQRLAGGESILIFPEGTMNKSNEPLAPFFDGAFRLAIETQTSLLPFAILNSKNHLPRANPLAIKPGIIRIQFGEPIDVKGLVHTDLDMLKRTTFNSIRHLLQQRKTPD